MNFNFDFKTESKVYHISWMCSEVHDFIFKNNKICFYRLSTPKKCNGEITLAIYRNAHLYPEQYGIVAFCEEHINYYVSHEWGKIHYYIKGGSEIEQLKNLIIIKDIIE